MAAPAQKSVNLLVRDNFEESTLGKTLNWLLSAGRVIVVLVELVVIGAFVSRFWFDRQLTDLNDENELRKVQIEAASAFEQDFRDSQNRLATYKQFDGLKTNSAGIIRDVSAVIPADVVLTNLEFSKEELTLRGLALSERGLAGFVKSLENSPKFEKPTLSDVSLGSEGQQILNFSIKTGLKREK